MIVPQPSRGILVVDDDEMMRELLSAIFAMEGYSVITASSGEEAIAAMQQATSAFDVVLADLHMPGLAGRELALQLSGLRTAPTALLGMSGREPSEAERQPFDAFLVKPFAMPDFMEALSNARDSHNAPSHAVVSRPDEHPAASVILDQTIFDDLAARLPPAQLHALYDLALQDVEQRTQAMREALSQEDVAACCREAHALKGGCAMVGAAELSALAADIEVGAFAGTPPLDELTSACSRLRGMLDARFRTPRP